jgi:glycine oxidase
MSAVTRDDVIVVGGGIIGLSAAWRMASEGARVRVVEARADGAASSVAAGMLTPVTEAYWGEDDLLRLSTASLAAWPAFAADLEAASGRTVDLHLSGVLAVAFDSDDLAVIDDLHRLHVEHDLASERLAAKDLREREPLLAPQVRGGVFASGDGAVDPRLVMRALGVAAPRAGVEVLLGSVDRIVLEGGRAVGVEVHGRRHDAGTVVLAAGSWSSLLPDLPEPPPVRPVFGEVARLRGRTPGHTPGHVIRAVVRGAHVYVVPRPSGEIVVGATSSERGYETKVTAGGVYELLRDARSIVPALDEAELVEVAAGLRPGTPDNAPLVGWSGTAGLFVATGHYRNGVLLAPITAEATAASVAGRSLPPEVSGACDPARFDRAKAVRS